MACPDCGAEEAALHGFGCQEARARAGAIGTPEPAREAVLPGTFEAVLRPTFETAAQPTEEDERWAGGYEGGGPQRTDGGELTEDEVAADYVQRPEAESAEVQAILTDQQRRRQLLEQRTQESIERGREHVPAFIEAVKSFAEFAERDWHERIYEAKWWSPATLTTEQLFALRALIQDRYCLNALAIPLIDVLFRLIGQPEDVIDTRDAGNL